MSHSARKLVVVFGATGKQGGSVAKALLADPEFRVRAVTRDISSGVAVALEELGAEVVQADLDAKETLEDAVRGAYACFLVTDFWAHLNEQRESKQGLDVLEACKKAGIKHLVYSGLENCKKLFGLSVPHFDGKGIVEEKIEESGVPFTNVRAAAYHENFPRMFVHKAHENSYAIGIPMADKPLYLIHIDEIGECVRTILRNPDEYVGKTIGLASDSLSVDQIVQVFNKHFGPSKTFFNSKMTAEDMENLGFPGADDLANMFRFYQTGKCIRDVALTRTLNPDILSFDDWVDNYKEVIEAGLDSE